MRSDGDRSGDLFPGRVHDPCPVQREPRRRPAPLQATHAHPTSPPRWRVWRGKKHNRSLKLQFVTRSTKGLPPKQAGPSRSGGVHYHRRDGPVTMRGIAPLAGHASCNTHPSSHGVVRRIVRSSHFKSALGRHAATAPQLAGGATLRVRIPPLLGRLCMRLPRCPRRHTLRGFDLGRAHRAIRVRTCPRRATRRGTRS